MTSLNFNRYIHKVLKQAHPDTGINSKALNQMNELLNVLGKKLARVASRASKDEGMKTVQDKHIEYALKVMFPREMSAVVLNNVSKSIEDYKNSKKSKSAEKKSSASRAGITFSPSRANELLETAQRKSKLAGVSLAAILEALCHEILDLAGNSARDSKRVRITPKDLMVVIENAENLRILVTKTLKFSISGAGEVVRVHQAHLPSISDKKKKRKGKKDGVRRARSGTVAVRDIKKMQKSTEFKLRKAPINRLVRDIAGNNVRISEKAGTAIQSFVEKYVVDLLVISQHNAFHADRSRVQPKDIKLAILCRGISGEASVPKLKKCESGDKCIGKNGLTRLARQANVKSISKDALEELRTIIISSLQSLLWYANTRRELEGRTTLDIKDVHTAEERMGKFVATGAERKTKRRVLKK